MSGAAARTGSLKLEKRVKILVKRILRVFFN